MQCVNFSEIALSFLTQKSSLCQCLSFSVKGYSTMPKGFMANGGYCCVIEVRCVSAL